MAGNDLGGPPGGLLGAGAPGGPGGGAGSTWSPRRSGPAGPGQYNGGTGGAPPAVGGRMGGMPLQQWVYQFRDCPEAGDVEVLAEEEDRPRQVVVRARPGAGGLVDGYILQNLDRQEHTALYTWVRAGDPAPVTAYLLDLLAEVCPTDNAR